MQLKLHLCEATISLVLDLRTAPFDGIQDVKVLFPHQLHDLWSIFWAKWHPCDELFNWISDCWTETIRFARSQVLPNAQKDLRVWE